MTNDLIEKIGNSVIQHGKLNNRVYIMKLSENDLKETIEKSEYLCKDKFYGKIFAKVPEKFSNNLLKKNFILEAKIPKFFKGKDDCIFLSKFYNEDRKKLQNYNKIKDILNTVSKKKQVIKLKSLNQNYNIRVLKKSDCRKMVILYKKVFSSYPFPIFDEKYLQQTMEKNIKYCGIWNDDNLIAVASAETDPQNLNSEMTDFATDPNYRGNNFSLYLLKYLENYLIANNYKTLYTIARSVSYGMNITFKKNGYKFSGTLKNNTNIAGNIESMNVWYKNI